MQVCVSVIRGMLVPVELFYIGWSVRYFHFFFVWNFTQYKDREDSPLVVQMEHLKLKACGVGTNQ